MAYMTKVAINGRSAQKEPLRNAFVRLLLLIGTFWACLHCQIHPPIDRDSVATTFVWRCSPPLDLRVMHNSLPKAAAVGSTSRPKGRRPVALPLSASSEYFESTASLSTELRLQHIALLNDSDFEDVADNLGTMPTIDGRSKEAIEHICNEELKFPGGCELRIVGLQSNFTAVHLSSDVDIGVHTPDHLVTLDERDNFQKHLARFDFKVVKVVGATITVASLDNIERDIVFLNQDFDASSKNDYYPLLGRQLNAFFESNEPAQKAVRMLKFAFHKSQRLPAYVLEYLVLILRNARLGCSERTLYQASIAQIVVNSKFFKQALKDATLANGGEASYEDYLIKRVADMQDVLRRALY